MLRRNKGRQKVQMTRMSKESNLLVTFSKRRSGLFKKASELCTLCGVEIAIIVFSPGKKVFSFGHPCVEAIIDRFATPNSTSSSSTLLLYEAHRNANARELNMHLAQAVSEIELEKKRGEELGKMRKASQDKYWWEAPIEELGLEELEQLKAVMEELRENIDKRVQKLIMVDQTTNPTLLLVGSIPRGGVGGSIDAKVGSELGLTMTPHGYTIGFPRGFY